VGAIRLNLIPNVVSNGDGAASATFAVVSDIHGRIAASGYRIGVVDFVAICDMASICDADATLACIQQAIAKDLTVIRKSVGHYSAA